MRDVDDDTLEPMRTVKRRQCIRCGTGRAVGLGADQPKYCRPCYETIDAMERAVLGRPHCWPAGRDGLKCTDCGKSSTSLSSPSRLCRACVARRFPLPDLPPLTNEQMDLDEMLDLSWLNIARKIR